MHARGIAHLDLKPSNILISPNGRPLIIDFNLSAPVDQCVRSLGGTIPYMAPESLHSLELQRVDPRLDIFSLGVIFFELLVGKLPFGLPTPNTSSLEQVQQMLRLQNESPDPVRRLGIQLPSAWKYVLRHTLALDQQQRFATAAELQVALLELTRNPPQSWLLGCRRWFVERLTGKN